MNHVDLLEKLAHTRSVLGAIIREHNDDNVPKLLAARDQVTWQMHRLCEQHAQVASLDVSEALASVDRANARLHAGAATPVDQALVASSDAVSAVRDVTGDWVAICTTRNCGVHSDPGSYADALQWKQDHCAATNHPPNLVVFQRVRS